MISSLLRKNNFWKIAIAETVTDNENENLSDTSANGIEALEDDETEELKEIVEEDQTVTEDFETDDISGHANFFKLPD